MDSYTVAVKARARGISVWAIAPSDVSKKHGVPSVPFATAQLLTRVSLAQAMPSALTYAKRAECFIKLKKPVVRARVVVIAALLRADASALFITLPQAAIKDADAALALNPDSAKALKMRGLAHRLLGAWEAAAKDLGAAQGIDFDESVVDPLKLVVDKAAIVRKRRVDAENAEKNKCVLAARCVATQALTPLHQRRRQEEARAQRAQREAEAAAAAAAASGGGFGGGDFPGMGGMGGMPGMGACRSYGYRKLACTC